MKDEHLFRATHNEIPAIPPAIAELIKTQTRPLWNRFMMLVNMVHYAHTFLSQISAETDKMRLTQLTKAVKEAVIELETPGSVKPNWNDIKLLISEKLSGVLAPYSVRGLGRGSFQGHIVYENRPVAPPKPPRLHAVTAHGSHHAVSFENKTRVSTSGNSGHRIPKSTRRSYTSTGGLPTLDHVYVNENTNQGSDYHVGTASHGAHRMTGAHRDDHHGHHHAHHSRPFSPSQRDLELRLLEDVHINENEKRSPTHCHHSKKL